ncbi:extracellular solute-binding protein [Streptomyces diastatochromogenes]|uniref:Sugar ABC transporter substrate-binding protein n=1 Tax=Streptomyces diastatochromogenes TaxID=42236 RepID=A0A233RPC9_STRDA|nr:extracellular solute-binding protein [Streptomyces diastatochromogenes]MCZ0984823.1 extracellular solute-binding protein [Streptomyces diastatochromogenes]OXY85257.1 sugar ABC transporter substrate-binding protein [Streptomyces diastatochromogenes]
MATRMSTRLLVTAGAAALALTVTACGSSGRTTGSGSGDGTLVWALTQGSEATFRASATEWNKAHADSKVDYQFFQNDPYKQKLRTAVGAGNGPVLFENWGGGALADYVKAGKVADLTPDLDKNPEWKNRIFPSVLKSATIDGKVYGVPVNGVQPVVLYFNKDLFQKAGAEPPKTWDDLLALVKKFKAQGIAPISMGGASKWPDLMWLEYLVDRVGGPDTFANIAAGKKGAWSDPAVLKSAQMIKQLVDAGGFARGFTSVSADAGQAEAQVYTGKAAMILQGSWGYGTIASGSPKFVSEGHLGWAGFPAVTGGKGDATNIVGNTANFFSVSAQASAKEKKTAVSYLKDGVYNDSYVDSLLKNGDVPPVKDLDAKLKTTKNADWTTYVYHLTRDAKSFQLSWDQALSPALGDALLTHLDQLFLGQISPQQFCAQMDQAAAK